MLRRTVKGANRDCSKDWLTVACTQPCVPRVGQSPHVGPIQSVPVADGITRYTYSQLRCLSFELSVGGFSSGQSSILPPKISLRLDQYLMMLKIGGFDSPSL